MQILLATRVATMMGRKLEEDDWSAVYCAAKKIPTRGWSNLNIDVMHYNLGVEHKMLCVRSRDDIRDYCGTTQMHPSATRSIRIPESETDATKAAREILRQYGQLISNRSQKIQENAPDFSPDMRTGWLLWEESLRQFIYFEQRMTAPIPEDYTAEWNERGSRDGLRKSSRNLWVYETTSGKKRFSITTSAGPKIQPYFDVPPPSDPNLYIFTVQGEVLQDGRVRIWITNATATLLKATLGSLDADRVSAAIINAAKTILPELSVIPTNESRAVELVVTAEAYGSLKTSFAGVSDEHMIQLVVKFLEGS